MPSQRPNRNPPAPTKRERYLQPSILLGLKRKQSYGYELIQTIQEYGFIEGQAPPGMIYRHLRQLEEDRLVVSEWKTEGSGPARRMYALTEEGGEVLAAWIDYMSHQAAKINQFIARYHEGEDPSI
jgi:poly-beta-hydroxybutyrate-responsive repressor